MPSGCDRGFVLKLQSMEDTPASTFDMTVQDDAAAQRFAGEIFDFLVAEDVQEHPDDETKRVLIEQRDARLSAVQDLWPDKLVDACRSAILGSELPEFDVAQCTLSVKHALVGLTKDWDRASQKKRVKVTAPRGIVPPKTARFLTTRD